MKQSDIARAYAEGRSLIRSFSKNVNVATTAGTDQDLSMSPGNPPAQYYVGAIATATALARSTDGGLDHGADKPDAQKFLHTITLQTVTAAAAPLTLDLLDYLMFYPFIGMDTGIQACTTGITLPRYTAADGVQIMVVEQNPYAGAATLRVTYKNQAGVGGRVTPTHTLNSVTNIGTIATAAPTLAGATGKFMALQSGDYGVQEIESVEILTGDVGIVCFVLVKPLITFAIFDSTVPSVFDLWNHLGFLPRIRDDAFLNFVIKPAANINGAALLGSITTIWNPNT